MHWAFGLVVHAVPTPNLHSLPKHKLIPVYTYKPSDEKNSINAKTSISYFHSSTQKIFTAKYKWDPNVCECL